MCCEESEIGRWVDNCRLCEGEIRSMMYNDDGGSGSDLWLSAEDSGWVFGFSECTGNGFMGCQLRWIG